MLHDSRIFKCHGNGHEVADLDIVTAAVRSARYRIGVRVIAADDGIELSQKGDGLFRISSFHAGLHSRDAPTVRVFESKFVKSRFYFGRGFLFFKAQLRFSKNIRRNLINIGETLVNCAAHRFF